MRNEFEKNNVVIGKLSLEVKRLTKINKALLEAAKIGLDYLESDYIGIGGNDLSNGSIKKIRKAIAQAEGK